jgi:transaldolase
MTERTPTCLWNDSAASDELKYSIEHGGVGATCNPVIVVDVLKKEMDAWHGRIQELIRDNPTATEGQIGWKLVEDISVKGAAMFLQAAQRPEWTPLHADRSAVLSKSGSDLPAGEAF